MTFCLKEAGTIWCLLFFYFNIDVCETQCLSSCVVQYGLDSMYITVYTVYINLANRLDRGGYDGTIDIM